MNTCPIAKEGGGGHSGQKNKKNALSADVFFISKWYYVVWNPNVVNSGKNLQTPASIFSAVVYSFTYVVTITENNLFS